MILTHLGEFFYMKEIRREIPQQLVQPEQIGRPAFKQEVMVNKVGGEFGKFVNPRAYKRIEKESAHDIKALYEPYGQAFLNENPGAKIAYCQVGEPKRVPSLRIRKASADALMGGKKKDLGYMSPQGDTRILEGIANYYNEVFTDIFKTEVDPKRVVWNGPGKTFLNAIAMAAAQPIVAVKDSCYIGERSAGTKSFLDYEHDGIEVGLLGLPQQDGHLNQEEAKKRLYAKKPKLMILDEPGNPTSTTFNNEEVKLIEDYVEDRARFGDDVLVVVDGAYDRYVYDKKIKSLGKGKIEPNLVYVQTPSKAWRFTSLRGGWGVFQEGQEDLQQVVTDQLNDAFGPGNTPLGLGMLAGLTKEGDRATKRHVTEYRKKRDNVRDALDRNGFKHGTMDAAFYGEIEKPEVFESTRECGIWTARKAGLYLLPGNKGSKIDVYTKKPLNPDGDTKMRLSYGEDLNKIIPAIDRWAEALNGNLKKGKENIIYSKMS